jgi:chromosome segregation ATPase
MTDVSKLTEEQIEEEKKKAIAEALAPIEEELKKLKDKDFNFNNARKGKEEILAENEAKEKRIKELEDNAEKLKKTVDTVSSRYRNELVKSIVGSDEELKKTVEANYLRLKGDKENLSDDEERVLVEEAYTLATKTDETRGVIQKSQSSAGGNNRIAPVKKGDEVDPEVKGWADQFNKMVPGLDITEEDIKKYTNK